MQSPCSRFGMLARTRRCARAGLRLWPAAQRNFVCARFRRVRNRAPVPGMPCMLTFRSRTSGRVCLSRRAQRRWHGAARRPKLTPCGARASAIAGTQKTRRDWRAAYMSSTVCAPRAATAFAAPGCRTRLGAALWLPLPGSALMPWRPRSGPNECPGTLRMLFEHGRRVVPGGGTSRRAARGEAFAWSIARRRTQTTHGPCPSRPPTGSRR